MTADILADFLRLPSSPRLIPEDGPETGLVAEVLNPGGTACSLLLWLA